MTRIEKAKQTAAPEQSESSSAAGAAPQEADTDAAHRFSDLLSGRRNRDGGTDRDSRDVTAPLPGRPQGGAQNAAGGSAPASGKAARATPLPGRPQGSAQIAAGGSAPASGKAARATPLPGPAELLSRRPAEAAAAPAREDALPKGAHRGGAKEAPLSGKHDPRGNPAGDAQRLAEGGALAAAGQTPAQRLEAGVAPLGGTAAAGGAETADVDIISELADRILVAEPKAGQNEVRIRLSIDTLQGTEITLKNDGSSLSVAFETPSPDIAERLAAAREGLTERLRDKTGLDVSVEIGHAGKEDKDRGGERNDGRSRNRFDYDPDSGDDA